MAQQRLTQLGLLVEERRHRRARGAVLVVGLAVLALGVLRLGQGWWRGSGARFTPGSLVNPWICA